MGPVQRFSVLTLSFSDSDSLTISRLALWGRRKFWGSAGRLHIVKSLLKKGSAEPQRFCRTLGAKPSLSGPADFSDCGAHQNRKKECDSRFSLGIRRMNVLPLAMEIRTFLHFSARHEITSISGLR